MLDGRYRVYFGGQAIAQAKGSPPTAPRGEPLTLTAKKVMYEKARRKRLER